MVKIINCIFPESPEEFEYGLNLYLQFEPFHNISINHITNHC